MRMTRLLAVCGVVLASMASFAVAQPAQTASVAVGPQYDTTHGGERDRQTPLSRGIQRHPKTPYSLACYAGRSSLRVQAHPIQSTKLLG